MRLCAPRKTKVPVTPIKHHEQITPVAHAPPPPPLYSTQCVATSHNKSLLDNHSHHHQNQQQQHYKHSASSVAPTTPPILNPPFCAPPAAIASDAVNTEFNANTAASGTLTALCQPEVTYIRDKLPASGW